MSDEEWLWRIDTEALVYLYESYEARALKRELIKGGFDSQLSLYGVLTNVETNSSEYRRMEVFKDAPWTQKAVMYVKDFFVLFKPRERYTLWAYRSSSDEIRKMGAYR